MVNNHQLNICKFRNILDKLRNILTKALLMQAEKNQSNAVLFTTTRIKGNGNVRVLPII